MWSRGVSGFIICLAVLDVSDRVTSKVIGCGATNDCIGEISCDTPLVPFCELAVHACTCVTPAQNVTPEVIGCGETSDCFGEIACTAPLVPFCELMVNACTCVTPT